jgi:hypothetical protein
MAYREVTMIDVNYFCRSTTIILAGRAQVEGCAVPHPGLEPVRARIEEWIQRS